MTPELSAFLLLPPVLSACALMLLGFGLIVCHHAIQRKKETARQWPQCAGILRAIDKTGFDKIRGAEGPYQYRRYILSVHYTYALSGKTYDGWRISFGADITHAAEVETFCQAFSEGQQVNVYYDPAKPEDSVLLMDRPGKKHRELYFGLILIVLATLMLSIMAAETFP